jgi:hypothetical protein
MSWQSTFAHPVALGKAHQEIACERCHTKAGGTIMGFPEGCVACHGNHHRDKSTLCARCHLTTRFLPATFTHPRKDCLRCHKRPHPDRGPCLLCHTQQSWASRFRHPITLAGVHTGFACERCHTSGLNQPGRACSSCHGSKHGGLTQCQQCHTMGAWLPSRFRHGRVEHHGASAFPCTACHPGGNFAAHSCTCHGGSPPGGD